MTKKEIVKEISERAELTQLKTKEIVQWTFDAIVKTLIQDGRIELRNFGVFEVKRRKARKARNPRTGAKVDVEPKNVVTFQPGKEMEEKVRQHARVADRPTKVRKVRGPMAPGSSSPSQAHNEMSHDAELTAVGAH
jgi:nucleoid DNA-binding protein